MQAYGPDFAFIYNLKWSNFAHQVTPLIHDFYAATPIGQRNKSMLDLCCGAGHMAACFLEKGYKVVGIDLSESMLKYARENAGTYLDSGQARFVQADAADFRLDERFGLVVSTYDSLNHLENEKALINCFHCVHAVCDGYFIFDLNTRKGLKNWDGTRVDDSDADVVIINRGNYDGDDGRAWMTITGFVAIPDGLYRRFDETVFNTVFDLERVEKALYDVGWKKVHFARIKNLSDALASPEEENRVFVVAGK